MKTTLFAIAVIIVALSSSCIKDPVTAAMKNYTCTCVSEEIENDTTKSSSTITTEVPSLSKKDAQTACSAGNSNYTYTSGDITYLSKTTCTIN